MYSLRANNDNTVHFRIHGTPDYRYLPVFQIKNWWATTLPTYVYVDGVGLTSGSDYYAALDDNINQLTIGFNRIINGNSVIFIDDNNNDGYRQVWPTKKMYCGVSGLSSEYFWVKNTSGSYLGAASDNDFYLNWKMNTSSPKDGELWQMRSSVTNPNALIDTATGDNLIPGSDAGSGLFDMTFNFANYIVSSMNVSNVFTYAVEESSLVRVRLRINERIVKNVDSLCIVSRWTIYPTGQFFRYDSIYKMSGAPQDIYINTFVDDSLNATVTKNGTKKRGSIVYTTGYPDMVSAWLSMRNASGYQSDPFDADTMGTLYSYARTGVYYTQSTNAPSKWNSTSVQFTQMVDMHHSTMNSSSRDSIANGFQCLSFSGRPVLSMITGTLINTVSSGDLNGDGFAEQEGAYIVSATGNVVNFRLPAHGDTCRYYPAFRVQNYTAVNKPQYLFVYAGADTNELLEGYQFNSYVKQSTHELLVQIDSIFCDSVGIFISADRTLAVQMSSFNARPGNRCDTLIWRTESEQENLGYRIERRINRMFYDSISAVPVKNDSTEISTIPEQHLFKGTMLKVTDTVWASVNKRIIPGAPQGASYGPRDYKYIDFGVHNDILYEYRLIAVDYHQKESEHGPVSVMPRFFAPIKFMLGYNFPNPFRHTTSIRFALPEENTVTLNVYSMQGRLIRRLVRPDRKFTADFHQVLWDGTDEHGQKVATGPYIYRMNSGNFVKSRIMLIIR
jgi:hypothetical protein